MIIRLLCAGTLLITMSSAMCQELSFDGIAEIKPLKRGNTYQIMWSGGNESDRIIIELVNNNQNFGTWEQSSNQGKAAISLSSSLKPNDNYYLKISNRETDVTTISTAIEIRRKIPLGIKLMSIALVPIAIIMVSSNKDQDIKRVAACLLYTSPSPRD